MSFIIDVIYYLYTHIYNQIFKKLSIKQVDFILFIVIYDIIDWSNFLIKKCDLILGNNSLFSR